MSLKDDPRREIFAIVCLHALLSDTADIGHPFQFANTSTWQKL